MSFSIVEVRQSYADKIVKAIPEHRRTANAWDTIEGQLSLALRSNPKLLGCEPMSIIYACYRGARLGLDISGASGQAYLLPYGRTAQLIIGVKGWQALVCRATGALQVRPNVVYKGEDVSWDEGTSPYIKHTPHLDLPQQPGVAEARFAYAIAEWGDERRVFRLTPLWALMAAKQASRGGLWRSHFHEMACKTAVRYLAKSMDTSPDIQQELDRDDKAEVGALAYGDDTGFLPIIAPPGQQRQAAIEAELGGGEHE